MGVAGTGAPPDRLPSGSLPALDAAVVLATVGVAALTLLLAKASGWNGQGRPSAFEYLFLRNEPAAAWLTCLVIVVAVLASRAQRVPDRPFVAQLARKPLPFIACVTIVLAASAVLVYRGHALSMDEYAPLFQARVFARGRLMAEVPPELVRRLVPPVRWFIEASPDGRMLSSYWPGFALLLTPFAWAGAPWLLNPLIGGATLLVVWWIARRLWPDTAAAGWAVLLTAASPAFVVNAISLYSMPAHLLASLCFTALLLDPTPRRLLCAGAVGSLASTLHHPLPHALYAVPWLVALALRRRRVRNLATLAAGYLPGLLVLGGGWFWVRAQVGGNEETAARGLGAVAAALGRLAFTLPSLELLRSRVVNVCELALWAVPGMLALACAGGWWRRAEPAIRLFAASAFLTLAAYLFVPFDQGHGWGYRYFHAAWGVLPLLAAGALEHPAAGASLRRMTLVAALASLVLGTGLRFFQVRSFIDGQLRQVPAPSTRARFEVVFLRLDRGYYTVDLVQNDPFLEGSRWILLSSGPQDDARFMAHFFPGARCAVRTPVAELWQLD